MIVEILNSYYEKMGDRKHAGYFYITDVSKCPRMLFYDITGVEGEPVELEGIRRMRAGSAGHMKLMGDLFSSGMRVVASEVNIPENPLIHGRADCIVSLNNEDLVIDFKTIAGYGFTLIQNDKLNSEHIEQMQLYLHFLQKEKGIIVYECKNTQELLEIPVNYNKEICEGLLNRLRELKGRIDRKELPGIPENLPSWKCAYCRFSKICKEEK